MPKRTPHIFSRSYSNARALIAYLLLLLVLPLPGTPVSANNALANTTPTATQHTGTLQTVNAITTLAPHTHHTAILDLSSTLHNAVTPHHLTGQVSILEGGISHQISAGAAITSAERLAVEQVMTTGHQSLILNAAGVASGGTFSISPTFSQHFTSLVIPTGVTALDNVAKSGALNLAGTLNNAGTLLAYSTSPSVISANITAQNIVNQTGGLISTVISDHTLVSQQALHALNLNLTALNNFANNGTISSSGMLSVSGSNVLNGISAVSHATANAASSNLHAVLSSQQSLNLYTASGNLTNAGSIISALNNINVATATTNNLTINSLNGVWRAPNGNINFGDATNTSKINTTISGGQFQTNNVNINSGNGTIEMTSTSVAGTINVVGGIANLTVQNGLLQLGAIKLSGDPTFYNTGGDLVITGNLNFAGSDLALIASGNIYATSALTTITANNVNIVAGANMTVGSGSVPGSSSANVPSTSQASSSTTITVTNVPSATGGNVDLTGAASNLTINGLTTLVAYNTVGGNKGQVLLPTSSTINGGAIVYSEAAATQSIQIGNATYLYASDRTLKPNTVVFQNGTITAGYFDAVFNGYLQGSISAGTVGSLNAFTGGNPTANITVNAVNNINSGLVLMGNNINIGNVAFTGPTPSAYYISGFGNNTTFGTLNPATVDHRNFSGTITVTGGGGGGGGGGGAGGGGAGGGGAGGGGAGGGGGGGGGGGSTASGGTSPAIASFTATLGNSTGPAVIGTSNGLGSAQNLQPSFGSPGSGLYLGRTPQDNTPFGISFAAGAGAPSGPGVSIGGGSSYWQNATRLAQSTFTLAAPAVASQSSSQDASYWFNKQWTMTAAQPEEPSYYYKAMALAAISQARADALLKLGMLTGTFRSYDYQAAVDGAQMWRNYASIGGTNGKVQSPYGLAPQIVQYPGTWLQMILTAGPTVFAYLPPGFYDWAVKYSGGKPITNYTMTESGSAFNPRAEETTAQANDSSSTGSDDDGKKQKQFDINNIRDPHTGDLVDPSHLAWDPSTGEYVNKDTLQRYNPASHTWTTDNGDFIQSKYYDQKTQQWVNANGDSMFKGTVLNQPVYDPVTGESIPRQYLSVAADGTITDVRNGNVYNRATDKWTDTDGNSIKSLAQVKDIKGNIMSPTRLTVDDNGNIVDKQTSKIYDPNTKLWTNPNGTVAGLADGKTINDPTTNKPVDLNDLHYDAATGKVTNVQSNLSFDPKTDVWTNQYGEPLKAIGSESTTNLKYDFSTHRFTNLANGNVYDPLLKQWFSADGNAIANTPYTTAQEDKPVDTNIKNVDGKTLTADKVLATSDVGHVVDTGTNNTFDQTADKGKQWTDQYGYTVLPTPVEKKDTPPPPPALDGKQKTKTDIPHQPGQTERKPDAEAKKNKPDATPDQPNAAPTADSGTPKNTNPDSLYWSNYQKYLDQRLQLSSRLSNLEAVNTNDDPNVSMQKDLHVFDEKYSKQIALAAQAYKAGALPAALPGTTESNAVQEAAERWNYVVVNDGPIRDQSDLAVAVTAMTYSLLKSPVQATIDVASLPGSFTSAPSVLGGLAHILANRSESMTTSLGQSAAFSHFDLTNTTQAQSWGIVGVNDAAKADTASILGAANAVPSTINKAQSFVQNAIRYDEQAHQEVNQAANTVTNFINKNVLHINPFPALQNVVTVNLTNRASAVAKSPILQVIALDTTSSLANASGAGTVQRYDNALVSPNAKPEREWLPPAAVPITASTREYEIKTNFGTAYCDKGSMALILDLGKATCVYVLESHAAHRVTWHYRGNSTKLAPGKAYIFTDEPLADANKILNGTGIAVRNLKAERTSKRAVAVGDFSIPATFLQVPALGVQLKANDPATQKIVHNVLKNATILSQLQAPDGAFPAPP